MLKKQQPNEDYYKKHTYMTTHTCVSPACDCVQISWQR